MPHPRLRLAAFVASSLLLLAPNASAGEALEQVPDPAAGAAAWQRCAVCHGADGAGLPDGTFPKIAGQHASVIESQLAAIRSGERPNPVMKPHVEDLVDDRDVADVVAHVAAMPRDETCHPGPGDDLDRGARLYRDGCAECHGDRGEGDAAQGVPWLACQHYAYLLRRARLLASWGRNAHPETQPPLSELTDRDLRAVVDHAARLAASSREETPGRGGGAEADPAD
jgi:cytochrome c553